MGTIMIKLRKVKNGEYALFGPQGNQISSAFRGHKYAAIEWARRFISSWYNWGVDTSEIDDEEKNRIPDETVRPPKV